MTKHSKYHKRTMSQSVLGVVRAQCLDYDRRARLLLDPFLPEDIKESFTALNLVIDNAMKKLDSGIRETLFRDVQLGRGFYHSPVSALISKNAYYARKWDFVREIAEGYLLM